MGDGCHRLATGGFSYYVLLPVAVGGSIQLLDPSFLVLCLYVGGHGQVMNPHTVCVAGAVGGERLGFLGFNLT